MKTHLPQSSLCSHPPQRALLPINAPQLQKNAGSLLLLSLALCSGNCLAATTNSLNVPITGNAFTYALLANPYSHGGNTVKEIFSSTVLPSGTTVHKFKPDGTYGNSVFTSAWSVPTLVINPGEGFFLSFPREAARALGGATLQLTFSGEISSGTKLPAGGVFAMIGSPIDRSGRVVSDLGYPVSEGDTLYKFDVNSQSYDSEIFEDGNWASGSEPSLGFASGFFLVRQPIANLPAQWNGAAPVTPTTPGQFVSAVSFGGAAGDGGQAVAVDSSGSIFVVGSSGGGPFITKSSPSGSTLWSKTGGGHAGGTAQAVAVDAGGNVLVTGNFDGTLDFGGGLLTSAGGYDIFVAKFSSAGDVLWSKRVGSSKIVTWVTESGLGIAVDANNNVAVTGLFDGALDLGGGTLTTGGQDLFLAKFSSNGNHLWSRSLKTGGTTGAAITMDVNGNIFLTGSFCLTADFGGGPVASTGVCDMFIAKYSPGGASLWVKHFGEPVTYASLTIGTALALDHFGNVVVTGTFQMPTSFGGRTLTNAGSTDIFLAKYSGTDGAPLWSERFGGRYAESANAVVIDHADTITLTGRMGLGLDFGGGPLPVVPGVMNGFLANFAPDGTTRWAKSFGFGTGEATGLAVNPAGLVLVTGRFSAADFGGGLIRSQGYADIFLAEFAP